MSSLEPNPSQSGGDFDPEGQRTKLAELEKQTLEPDFWGDKQKADSVFAQINAIKDTILPFEKLIKDIDETYDLIELYEEEDDGGDDEESEESEASEE